MKGREKVTFSGLNNRLKSHGPPIQCTKEKRRASSTMEKAPMGDNKE